MGKGRENVVWLYRTQFKLNGPWENTRVKFVNQNKPIWSPGATNPSFPFLRCTYSLKPSFLVRSFIHSPWVRRGSGRLVCSTLWKIHRRRTTNPTFSEVRQRRLRVSAIWLTSGTGSLTRRGTTIFSRRGEIFPFGCRKMSFSGRCNLTRPWSSSVRLGVVKLLRWDWEWSWFRV